MYIGINKYEEINGELHLMDGEGCVMWFDETDTPEDARRWVGSLREEDTEEIEDCDVCLSVYSNDVLMGVRYLIDGAWYVEAFSLTEWNREKAETFYTGGGIWITALPQDEKHYYTIDNDFMDCLTFYEDRFEGWQDTEYPCKRMVWSKNTNELNSEERLIYKAMKADLMDNMR